MSELLSKYSSKEPAATHNKGESTSGAVQWAKVRIGSLAAQSSADRLLPPTSGHQEIISQTAADLIEAYSTECPPDGFFPGSDGVISMSPRALVEKADAPHHEEVGEEIDNMFGCLEIGERLDPYGALDPDKKLADAIERRVQKDKAKFAKNPHNSNQEFPVDEVLKRYEIALTFLKRGTSAFRTLVERNPDMTVVEILQDLDRTVMAYDDIEGTHDEMREEYPHLIDLLKTEFPQIELRIIPFTDRANNAVNYKATSTQAQQEGLQQQIARQLNDPRVNSHLKVEQTISLANGPEMQQVNAEDPMLNLRYSGDDAAADQRRYEVVRTIAPDASFQKITDLYHPKLAVGAKRASQNPKNVGTMFMDDMAGVALVDDGKRVIGFHIDNTIQPRTATGSEWDLTIKFWGN